MSAPELHRPAPSAGLAGVMKLVRLLPPGFIRLVGGWQFRIPALRWVMLRLHTRLTAGEVTIRHGVGAGLRFDATGGLPGYALGTSDPAEQEMVHRCLHPGGVFYDVGANIGFFTTIAARLVGPSGSVWGFEPFPASAARARQNAARNDFTNVTLIEAAVSDHVGQERLEVASSLGSHRLGTDGEDGLVVDVISLDEWWSTEQPPAPDLVMIDVEGGELEVLEGMLELLSTHRPTILCEVHLLGARFDDFVAQHLSPLGYTLSALPQEERLPGRWHALLTA